MTTVFIAGSISIKRLNPLFEQKLKNIVTENYGIVVGDAKGVDTSIQRYLFEHEAKNVTVYCSGVKPRNNVGLWRTISVQTDAEPGSRAYFTAKDREMARIADYGLMLWDSKSTGTLSNVIELLGRGRKSKVFINKEKKFLTVRTQSDLNDLVLRMSEAARHEAEKKISLAKKLNSLANLQLALKV